MSSAWNTAGLRIALTGATGFLGRHVAGALRAGGAEPVADAGDVCGPLTVEGPIHALCHLAGRTGARFSSDIDSGVRVNVTGTLQALELCRRLRCRLVLASSCAVYRPCQGSAQEDAPRGPIDAYGLSKHTAEGLCREYATIWGTSVAILRLFNPYGAGQSPDFLIPSLCLSLHRSESVRLRHPYSVRDFVHASDVAEIIRRACVSSDRWLVLNVGSGAPYRVLDVAHRLATLAGPALRWEQADHGEDPYGAMWADISTLRTALEWSPRISLDQGLRMMWQAQEPTATIASHA
jgi:nucleoside-diphosphate-sugar epimerase